MTCPRTGIHAMMLVPGHRFRLLERIESSTQRDQLALNDLEICHRAVEIFPERCFCIPETSHRVCNDRDGLFSFSAGAKFRRTFPSWVFECHVPLTQERGPLRFRFLFFYTICSYQQNEC